MEAGALLLLLITTFDVASTRTFYGQSVNFKLPRKKTDGTFEVMFCQRQNDRNNCQEQSDFQCDAGVCTSFLKSSIVQTDQDGTGQHRWCQTESYTTASVPANRRTFSMRASGCCWLSNINGRSDWSSEAVLNLGTRSDTRTLNSCPVTTTMSYLRVPQNCFTEFHLLAQDPDGDKVRCSFANASDSWDFSLDQDACTLTSPNQASIGVHVFDIVLEDFPTKNITLTHANGIKEKVDAFQMTSPLCKVTLQFSLEILPTIPRCDAAHVQPSFVSDVSDVLCATVGQEFEHTAQARAYFVSIHDFQVSGPANMTKTFTDEPNGKASVSLHWTPQQRDVHKTIPLCLTAETDESQSDMKCVVIVVVDTNNAKDKAVVHCAANTIEVALDKSFIPDLDISELTLLDGLCSLSSNTTHVMATLSFHTCGTVLEDKGTFYLYKNAIKSAEPPNTIITQRNNVMINFSCRVTKTMSISSSFNIQESNFVFAQSSFGSFSYSFDIYLDNAFQNKVEPSAFPVDVKVLETMFLGIEVQTGLSNTRLFVEECKGTPDDNPDNPTFYYLIKNGCVEDETLVVHASGPHSYYFQIQAFKFSGDFDQVYITCSLLLCGSNNEFSRCAEGCVSEPFRRRKRDLRFETFSHSITQGPIRVFTDNVPAEPVADDSKERPNVVMMKQSDPPTTVTPTPVSKGFPREGHKPVEGSWEVSPGGTNVKTSNDKIWQIIVAISFATSLMALCWFSVLMVLLFVYVCYIRKMKEAEDLKPLLHSG